MNKTTTIASQFAAMNEDQAMLAELQTNFLVEGESVITIADTEFIIQKCPELFYKLIDVIELKHKLKATLRETPDTLHKVAVSRMLEIEVAQTTKLSNLKIDREAIKNIVVNHSNKGYRERNIIEAYNNLQTTDLHVENAIKLRHLQSVHLGKILSKSNLKHMGPLFRKDQQLDPVAKNYPNIKGLSSETEIYDMINQLLDYLNNNDENLIIKVGVFHFIYEYIQPFNKYSSYIGRFVTIGYLFPEIDIASYAFSNTLVQNRSEYYTLINETASSLNVGDLTAFVYKFICYIIDSINYILKFLEHNIKRSEAFNQKLDSLELTNNEKRCLAILYEAHLVGEPLTTNQLTEQSALSNPTALKCMSKLESVGIATIEKPGKQKIITLDKQWAKTI